MTYRLETAWQDHHAVVLDVAFRILGDVTEAEDAVQEAFARLVQTDASQIGDLRGWLIVVASRICLDTLRSARVRKRADPRSPEPNDLEARYADSAPDPADRVTLDESVSAALLIVLEQLSPAERTVFVLHDVFGYQFETVATAVGRSPAACRQLAARARRRIEAETSPARFEIEPATHRALTERFIAACSGGDLAAVMGVLDPEVVGGIDAGPDGKPFVRRGKQEIASTLLFFLGPGGDITLVSRPGAGPPGVLGFQHGRLVIAFDFEIRGGRITHIDAVREPAALRRAAAELGLQ